MVSRPLARKLVVLGDGACGKTSLLTVFTKGYFPTTYEPTVFENHVEMLQVDEQTVELSLWDTAGQEDFDRLRSLSYADTHVVMICFSVDSPTSLENVETKWIEEVNEHCAGVKIILIALKCDLRDDPAVKSRLARSALSPVSYDQGLAVARAIRANRYLECSAKHNRGVQEAIYEAARVAVGTKPKGGGSTTSDRLRPSGIKKRGCIIL
ncbi:small GTPase superfamily [Naematelia encephala]|uniref:GTP-binding protein RHO3 n=1 Tax=Naematelia encephala TaxID=71784 RepID=A0A1Y2AGM9_9TREE|nr:small GTPase superfamily [Naematelia encephala]